MSLTEEQIEKMTLREIAAASSWGWASPAILCRVIYPPVLRKIPLPKWIKTKAPILKKVSKWPQPQERLKEMVKEQIE